MAGYDTALSVKERAEQDLLRIPGVHGVSLGRLYDDQWAIFVHLTRKRPLDEVPAGERIPDQIEGVAVKVIEHDQMRPMIDSGRYRPLQGGCQITTENGAGTLGCFVVFSGICASGELLYITNQHVLPSGDVYQPSDDKHDDIGIAIQAVLNSSVDAAVGGADGTELSALPAIIDIGNLTGSYNVAPADLPYPVRKRGRTTGLTSGNVTNINYTGRRSDGWSFTNQVFITARTPPICQPGDSGSAVVDNNNRVVALLWGGPDSGSFAAASPIAAVLSAFSFASADCFPLQIATASVTSSQRAQRVATSVALRESVIAELQRTATGKQLASAFLGCEAELRALIDANVRVAAVWRRNQGHRIITRLVNWFQERDGRIPATLGGVTVSSALTEIGRSIERHGSEELRQALLVCRPYVFRALTMTWKEMLQSLDAE